MGSVGSGGDDMDIAEEIMRLRSLLHGGKPPLPNRLSSRQMKSVMAFCDALIPSAEAPAGATSDEGLALFYGTSASMAAVPEHVAGIISKKDLHRDVWLLRVALWLLSTWYGTFLFCGVGCLSTRFPFIRSLSQLDESQREKVLLKLSRSSCELRKSLFLSLKGLTVRSYFNKVDEKNGNPSWKAIGYCGRDPTFSPSLQPTGPLFRSVIDMSGPEQSTFKALSALGAPVAGDSSPLTLHCDAVVVGSGPGGGVVAGVLATAGYRVIVLDKGSYFPAASLSLLERPTSEQMYEKEGVISTDDLSILLLAGSTVGGGSAINWSASFKTPDHVLEEWRDAHGLTLFGNPSYREALEAVCDRMQVRLSTAAGTPAERLNSAVLRRGCAALGYPVSNIPVNAPGEHNCGWCHYGCKDGKKKGTTETWLADMAASGNGVVLAGCQAVKVTTTTKKGARRPVATGVIGKFKHGELVVKSKVTIVACGALNTPGLLIKSGLKNSNIGRHLHLHPCTTVWGYFPEGSESSSSWLDPEKKSYAGELLSTMTSLPKESDSSTYGGVLQPQLLHPGAFAAVIPWISSADFRRRMTHFSRTATIYTLARDRGTGCCREYPKSLTYKLDPATERILQRGTEMVLRIQAAAGAEEVGTLHRDGKVFTVKGSTPEELERFVRRESRRRLRDGSTALCSAHQMGSCRMGVEKKTSAVDPKGETWEVERLFVADTSVFPTSLGVNPMVTVHAIAYCIAQNILEALRASST